MNSSVLSTVDSWKELLSVWAIDGAIRRAAQKSLGLADNNPEILEFESALAEGDFSGLPPIELLPASSMAGAMGAYAASTGTIYLNQDWLNSAREGQIQAVLTEELGHFLDTQLNAVDTLGDEGELFSKILNQSLSPGDEERIRTSDDQISIVVDGEVIEAEAASYEYTAGFTENTIYGGTSKASPYQLFESQYKDKTFKNLLKGDFILESENVGNRSTVQEDYIALNEQNLDLTYSIFSAVKGGSQTFGNFELIDSKSGFYDWQGFFKYSDDLSIPDPIFLTSVPSFSATQRGLFGNEPYWEAPIGGRPIYSEILYKIKIRGNFSQRRDTEFSQNIGYLLYTREEESLESQLFGGIDYPPDASLTTYLANILADLGSGSTIESSTSYTLKPGEENLILTGFDDINGTGNGLDNIITGNDANNIINGKGGGDSMIGFDGDDIYYVNNAKDKVVEFEDQGVDTVRASINESLSANVEKLELLGNKAINATGNGLNNKITGNNAKNVIDGKGGADRMNGKGDDDTYYVNNKNDTVIEVANQGTDTVRSSISYTLENNVENLILITGKAINGTGNNLNNRIKGNNNRNNLKGKAGIDTLTGGLEKDTLTGGGDADKFIYNTINDSGTTGATRDVITDFAGADKINLSKIDADKGVSGNQEFVFIGSDPFTEAGQVRFNNGLLSVNRNDDLTADMQIKLLGVTTFDESSLIL